MICLVSVVQFFVIIAFYSIDKDIGLLVFGTFRFLWHSSWILVFVGLSPSSLFRAQTRILVLLVFGTSSLFIAQLLDIGFLLVFRHHRFLRHRRGYWFCWFLDHHRFLQHSSWILVFCWSFAIIAFQGIDEDIGFVQFFESLSLLRAQSQHVGSCVFSRNSILVFVMDLLDQIVIVFHQ